MAEYKEKEDVILEKAFIVGVNLGEQASFEQSMTELMNLAEACNMEVVGKIEQNLPAPHQSLYIGTGKVAEVLEGARYSEADIVIFNDTLSPTQIRNLQKELDMPILDRTALILEIFKSRAKTREAKLQVEVAQLKYLMPRLVGLHASLGRQGGGSGLSNKGSGEKKIELDKRRIHIRIHELEKELKQIEKERETRRKQRMNSGIPRVALVGYTNAGKSTLMNAMVEEYVGDDTKKVLEKDMLFATLDTTVRKIALKGKTFLLSDTVGFVSKLPHDLVKAFRSTLEEVREADLLLHVVDFSDENFKEQVAVTKETLAELKADHIPTIYVYNKADLKVDILPLVRENSIYMSAKTKAGLEELVELIQKYVFNDYKECEMLIPYDKGQIVSYLNEQATVKQTEYLENGIKIEVCCKKRDYEKYKEYLLKRE